MSSVSEFVLVSLWLVHLRVRMLACRAAVSRTRLFCVLLTLVFTIRFFVHCYTFRTTRSDFKITRKYAYYLDLSGCTRRRSWLRHRATNRKVSGSIPDGVIGIFHWHPSGRTVALGSISARNRNEHQEYILGVKAAGAYGWQPNYLHVPIVLKSGSLNFLEPSGPVKACNEIAVA
jgi:hypothetical protein